MKRILSKNRTIALFLTLLLLSGSILGCSGSKTRSADVDQKLELGIKYLGEQKYEPAKLVFREIIKIDSKNIQAYKGLSLACALQDKPEEAEKALRDGLQAASGNEQLKLALAGLIMDQGKNEQAEKIYRELIGRDRPSISAYQASTYYLSQAGRLTEAIAQLEQALTKKPQYQLYSLLAELYIQSGDQQKALAAINKSVELETGQSDAYKQLAELYKDRWAELISLGDQLSGQNQLKTGALYQFSGLFGMQQYAELTAAYENLGAEIKDTPRIKLLAAEAYQKLNQADKAGALVKTIKIADVKDAGMLADLANYYLAAGDQENASKLALQGIEADPTYLDNYTVFIKINEKSGQNLADIWGIKYLLAGALSFQNSMSQLLDYGFELSFLNEYEDVQLSKWIAEELVVDQAEAQKHDANTARINSCSYLDKKHNIVYVGYAERSSNWKPMIVRFHSPMISEGSLRGKPAKFVSFPDDSGFCNQPIAIKEDIPLEEHIKRAGYPIGNITFIDR